MSAQMYAPDWLRQLADPQARAIADEMERLINENERLRADNVRLAEDSGRKIGTLEAANERIVERLRATKEWVAFPAVPICIEAADLIERLREALQFYADPETYVAIGFFPDPPCGEFIEDFSETEIGWRPGARARRALGSGK